MPGLGEPLVVRRQRPGDAEVGHQRVAVLREQHVLRLDVAVDDAVLVGVLQRSAASRGDPERVVHRQLRARAGAGRAATLALDEGHGEPELAGRVAGVVHGEDVRVLEAGGGLDLALEALGAERVGQLGVQHLERDRALVPQIVGQEDRGHAAPPQLALEPVAVGQAALKLLAEVCHP